MVGHLLAGELISSLLITLKQNQVKVAPAFADRAWQHLQMPWLWGLTAESGLHAELGEFSIPEEMFFSSASSWRACVHNTIVTCKLNFPSWWCTTSMISSSTSAKQSVAWRNSPLNELLCVSQKVACLTCALIRHWIPNQSWLQMPALLDFPYRS